MARVKTKRVKKPVGQQGSRRRAVQQPLEEPVGNIVFERHEDEAEGH